VCAGIADQGGGIAPEIREQVFQPFYTTKRRAWNGAGAGHREAIVTRIWRTNRIQFGTRQHGVCGEAAGGLMPGQAALPQGPVAEDVVSRAPCRRIGSAIRICSWLSSNVAVGGAQKYRAHTPTPPPCGG